MMEHVKMKDDDIDPSRKEGLINRFLDRLKDKEWYVIGLIGIIGLTCGFIGYGRYLESGGVEASWLERVYFTLQLIGMEFNYIGGWVPPELEVARFLLPILTIYTIARAVFEVFRYNIGLYRIKLLKNHVVVAGLGEKGSFIVNDLIKKGDEVVGIEIDREEPSIKTSRDMGAWVVEGDAAREKTLLQAGIKKASALIVTCDDESTNIEVAKKAITLRKDKPLRTYVHIKDMRFCPLVEFSKVRKGQHRIRFFNVFESGARQLLKQYPPDRFRDLGSSDDIHIAIVGFGPLGENVLLKSLKMCHFPRGRKLIVMVLGEGVEKEGRVFRARYPKLDDIKDVRVEFKDVEMDQSGRFDPKPIFQKGGRMDMIYVCLEDDTLSQSCALNINSSSKTIKSPMVINMIQNTGFAMLLQKESNRFMKENKLMMFTPIRKACSKETVMDGSLDSIARAFHLHYILMEKRLARKKKRRFDRDRPSLKNWDSLPESLKESNRQAADHIDVKLRSIGLERIRSSNKKKRYIFTKDEVELLGEAEHNRWNAERFLDGWSLGKKDVVKKKSPYLLDWDDPDLVEEIKDYDREFIRSIPDILDLVEPEGYSIIKKK